jgi:aromatic ring-opening dioxygenase catalytic subunit (LigB family)
VQLWQHGCHEETLRHRRAVDDDPPSPLRYALGASDLGEKATSVFEGFQAGTLSMRCVQFGA